MSQNAQTLEYAQKLPSKKIMNNQPYSAGKGREALKRAFSSVETLKQAGNGPSRRHI